MSGGQESEPNSWELNGLNSLDLWDYTIELECLRGGEDLQLAAELGKTLLERNKELETALRQHQNVIEDQAQEIEYLTKQTAALREVNDSRLRIYEQLEVSIQDLERTNHRLALDHSADKKHVKSLTATIESLEVKCDDFQKTFEDLTSQLDIYKRKTEKLSDTVRKEVKHDVTSEPAVVLTPQKSTRVIDAYPTPPCTPDDVKRHEEILRLSDEIRENRVMLSQEQRRALELEEQLSSMVQENNRLQDQVRNWHRNQDEPKSMHEEFSILEEVRQGQVCVRCLRTTSDRAQDEMSSMMDAEEDDDRSGISSLCQLPCTGNGLQEVQEQRVHKLIEIKGDKERLLSITSSVDNNPYRELVEKYEALLEVQRSQVTNLRKNRKQPAVSVASLNNSAPLSLQEELQISGDYSQFSLKDTDEESGQGESGKVAINTKPIKPAENTTRKNFTRTPDLSEAETSSSGFADETSNKATQTEYDRPGSFLCTIADGEDCKFSIYDDGGNSIDSRFRNRPEYRELFKEIFTILKKAAENKDEGEKLPLLDDAAPAAKVPPVTPAAEDPPGDFTDDTQSVLSSAMSEQSINLSDITPPEGKENVPGISYNASRKENQTYDDVQGTSVESSVEPQKVLTPLVRQPLDYFAGSPHLRKKGSKNRNRKHSQERQICESPIMPSQPKVVQVKGTSRRKRDYRPLESSPLTRTPQENAVDWNGSTMQFYNRSINSPTPSGSGKSGKVYQGWNPETNSWDIKQSTASQEIHKLKRLELSYAEVLRNADKTKTRRRRHQ